MKPAQIAGGYKNFISEKLALRHSALSIIIVFISFLGAMHILIRASIYGTTIASDSRSYMGFAESIVSWDFSEEKLIWYPPFLSIILAFFRLLNVDIIDTARFINIIAFSLIILLAGHYLSHHIKSRFFVIGATFAVMLSYPIVSVSSFVLTDTLFILLTLLALVQMESFRSGRTAKSGLILSCIFSALAPLTRWIGITVIATGIILILTHPSLSANIRRKYAALYGTASSLPLAIWLVRNWTVDGTLTGSRADIASGQPLSDSLSQIGDTLHLWTFLHQNPGWMKYMLWAAAALAILETVRFVTALLKNPRPNTSNIPPAIDKDQTTQEWRAAVPFAAFTAVYLTTLLITVPITVEVPIDSRYLAPVWVPASIIAVILLKTFWLTTYRRSGISARNSSDGWSVRYNKSSGPIALSGWVLIFLILTITLAHNIRGISLYLDVITYYNPIQYVYTTTL